MPNNDKLTQQARIIEKLRIRPYKSYELAFDLHILRVPNRITELIDKGYVITRDTVYENGTHYTLYTLILEPVRKEAS